MSHFFSAGVNALSAEHSPRVIFAVSGTDLSSPWIFFLPPLRGVVLGRGRLHRPGMRFWTRKAYQVIRSIITLLCYLCILLWVGHTGINKGFRDGKRFCQMYNRNFDLGIAARGDEMWPQFQGHGRGKCCVYPTGPFWDPSRHQECWPYLGEKL